MTDVEAILKRIEGIDPKDPAKLDEIWRLVSLRTAAYPVFQLPHLHCSTPEPATPSEPSDQQVTFRLKRRPATPTTPATNPDPKQRLLFGPRVAKRALLLPSSLTRT